MRAAAAVVAAAQPLTGLGLDGVTAAAAEAGGREPLGASVIDPASSGRDDGWPRQVFTAVKTCLSGALVHPLRHVLTGRHCLGSRNAATARRAASRPDSQRMYD